MKITLKALALSAVIFGALTVSCKMGDGIGELDGSKWDATMIIDATEENTKNPMAEDAEYRRFWKQLGSGEKVAEITSTITIDKTASVLENTSTGKKTVAGFIFDLNEYKKEVDGKEQKVVDFCLLGVQPSECRFYLERYTGVAKQEEESLDTTKPTIGSYTPLEDSMWTKNDFVTPSNDQMSKLYDMSDDTKVVTNVYITQEVKNNNELTYVVKMGKDKASALLIGEYTRDAGENKIEATKDGVKSTYLAGGVAVYGNAPKGTKLVATYVQDKDSVTGKLFAEPVEE